MARPSHIMRLPPNVRESITRLREAGQTIDEILEWLIDKGYVDISRSSVGRHIKREDQVMERLRRSKVMADAVVRSDVDAPPDKLARLNHSLMHTAIFDLLSALDGDDDAMKELFKNPKTIEQISRALSSLSSSAKTDIEYRKQVREEVEREVQAKMRKETEERLGDAMKKQGLSKDVATQIRQKVLGIS